MPSVGYLQVHAYTSYAQIPLENVSITVTASDGTAIALRLTDRSGQIRPIEIPAPELSESQSPDQAARPFTVVTIRAQTPGYEQIEAENVQIFADTVTWQDLDMIPLAELPATWNKTEYFDTPAQNL